MTKDMTTGNPLKLIFGFFFPLLLGNLFQQFYSMADSIIVGRFVGVEAFAGISATGSINFMILGFLLGMCSGCALPVSNSFGAGDLKEMRRYFANAIYLSTTLAIVMSVLTSMFAQQILHAIGTPEDIFEESLRYISVIFGGLFATMLYNLASGVLRAVGDSRTPLFFLVFSCFVNVLLDLFCVVVLKMGVAGAAWATVASQLLSGILCVLLIFTKYDVLKIRGDEWKLSAKHISRLVGFGLPMGLQFSITAIGSLILQSAINTLGSTAVAAIGAGAKVQFVFTCPFDTLGVTLATYSSQNLGAQKVRRIREGVRKSSLIILAYAAVACMLIRTFGIYLAQMFIDGSNTEILNNTMMYLNTIGLFFPALLGIMVFRNVLQGLGYSRIAMFAGLFELVGRAFAALVLIRFWGYRGATLATPIAWVAANLLLVPAYIYAVKKLHKTVPDAGE